MTMIKKGILNHLIQSHDLASIEQHLIYTYLINNKISYSENSILSNYFKAFNQIPQLYFDTSELSISTIK
jgi:hypothetical protein